MRSRQPPQQFEFPEDKVSDIVKDPSVDSIISFRDNFYHTLNWRRSKRANFNLLAQRGRLLKEQHNIQLMKHDLHDAAITLDYRRYQASCIIMEAFNESATDDTHQESKIYVESRQNDSTFDYFSQKPQFSSSSYNRFFDDPVEEKRPKNNNQRKPMGILSRNNHEDSSFFPSHGSKRPPIASSFFS